MMIAAHSLACQDEEDEELTAAPLYKSDSMTACSKVGSLCVCLLADSVIRPVQLATSTSTAGDH